MSVSLILRLWHATDDEANKSRAFISNNTEVKASVGDMLGIDFKKKLTYHGTTSELGYVEFTYYVRGSAANILIVVRGYGEPATYKVYRSKTYNNRLLSPLSGWDCAFSLLRSCKSAAKPGIVCVSASGSRRYLLYSDLHSMRLPMTKFDEKVTELLAKHPSLSKDEAIKILTEKNERKKQKRAEKTDRNNAKKSRSETNRPDDA